MVREEVKRDEVLAYSKRFLEDLKPESKPRIPPTRENPHARKRIIKPSSFMFVLVLVYLSCVLLG